MRTLMLMVTKNIYVADGDQELFEEAAAYAGGMSPAVLAGLRLYVAQQRRIRKGQEMRQIEVQVQDGPLVTTKRFTGRELLRYEVRDELRVTTYRVYVTARQQLAVHTASTPDWGRMSVTDPAGPGWDDPSVWSGDWWASRDRSLRVYADVATASGELPAELVTAIGRALAAPIVEDLDI